MTMTIRRHRDGTFSLTGLTGTDVDTLAHGLTSAQAGLFTMPAWKMDNDHAYIARTAAKYERLALALRRLVADDNGRSLYGTSYRAELTNDNAYGDPNHVAYIPAD